MFKQLTQKVKSWAKSIGGTEVFSSLSVLPFSKYKKNYSKGDFLTQYEISLYANAALNRRAEKVSEVDFQMLRDEEPVDDEILDVLNNPNEAFTGEEFWGLYQKYYDIFGEVYILVDKESRMGGQVRINEMHLLRSDMVKPFFDKNTGRLTKIEYKTSEGTATYEGEQVIYRHRPSPSNPLRGESLLQAGIRQIEANTQIDEYHSKVLENGGRVDSILTFKNKTGGMSETQLNELKDKYQEEYGAASKAGIPMFLSGDTKYERIGLNPEELAYLETKKALLSDIVALTGVPKAVLGITSDETFANADAAIRIFLRETIRPLLRGLTTNLDKHLQQDGKELTFIDPTPQNVEETRKNIELANTINAVTTNEKRAMLAELGIELEEIPEGDNVMVPLNVVPLESERPQEKPEEKQKGFNHPLRKKSNRRIWHKLQTKRLDRRQSRLKSIVVDYFDKQRERVVGKLKDSSVNLSNQKNIIDDVFDTSIEIQLAKDAVLPALEEMLIEAGKDSKEIVGSDFAFSETPEIGNWLDKRGEVFATTINKTTFKKLQREFTESLSNGETRPQLIERIDKTYGDITTARAETIARTEVHLATQFGTLEGYKQGGLPIKIYVWAPGTRGGVRDEHQIMDGQEVPINDPFVYPDGSIAQFPGNTGDPAHDVNCQCVI